MNREQRRAAAADDRRAARRTQSHDSAPPPLPMIGIAMVIAILGYTAIAIIALALDLMGHP